MNVALGKRYGPGFESLPPGTGARRIQADTDSAWAGKVTFTVWNDSTTMAHELDVLKTDLPWPELYLVNGQVGVNPKECVVTFGPPPDFPCGVARVGGIPAIGPFSGVGTPKREVMTLDLKPGKYVLVCNLAGHYEMGEAAPLTIKPLP